MSALGLRRRRWRSVRRPKYRGFHFVRNEWLVTTVSRETEGTSSGPKRASSRSLGYRSGGSFLSREGPSTARPRTRPNRSSWLWPPVLVRRSGRCRGYCSPPVSGQHHTNGRFHGVGALGWTASGGHPDPCEAGGPINAADTPAIDHSLRLLLGWSGVYTCFT